MRHLIKNGCFRTDPTIKWVCHNDPGCFQLFFHGFLATDGFISLAQKSLCDLQRTEQLNLFSVFLLYDCCQPMVTGSPMMVMSGTEKNASSLSGISLLSPEGSDTADRLFLP